ncbi:hypothetical protein D039_2934A, partial [Vibrio parahaemolyticus EKP-028]
MQHKA